MIKEAIKNFNAGKKIHKPAVPTVKSNISRLYQTKSQKSSDLHLSVIVISHQY